MSQHSILQSHRLPSPIQVQKTKSFSPDGLAQSKKIGNYILSATLGSGTFSKVKLGYHTITRQKVAVKILDKTKIKDENDVEIMCREIHILKILRHPNIIQLYEILNIDRYIYIVMEYVEGKDLFEYIYSQNYLSEIKASYFFRQLISALEYIHTYGIVHRDIKPENILLDKNKKNMKLVDFGLSNAYMHGNLLTTACGSPCYASPEMVSGKAYDGFYSDLWSCGVVLYCMLSGKLPFDEEDIQVLYKKIKSANYIMPEYLSPVAKDFLGKIFKTNPLKRITLEEIKEHPFFNFGMNGGKATLTKGIFINIDTLPIDKELVCEIKEKYFKNNERISEDVIKANIAENKQNTITTTYYLLLKVKETEKNNAQSKLYAKRPNTSKNKSNCIHNNTNNNSNINSTLKSPHNTTNKKDKAKMLKNIIITTSNSKAFDNNYGKKFKKISFDSVSNYNNGNTFSEINSPKNDSVTSVNTNHIFKPKTKKIVDLFQHNNNNNSISVTNTNNNCNINNNKLNYLVINNFLPEQRSPKVTVNLTNQNKFNTSTSFTNNVLTTKIDLNEMLFHSNKHHHKNKNASRNITLPLSQGRKNKTISTSKTNNLFFSMTSFKKGIFDTSDMFLERKINQNKEMKSRMKYLINSPLITSNDTITVGSNKRKTSQPKTSVINENTNNNLNKHITVNNSVLPKTVSSNKSRQSSVGSKRNKKRNNNNRAFTKKIFEDDTSFISKTHKYKRNKNYNNIGLIDPNTVHLNNTNKIHYISNLESATQSGMCTEYPTSSASRNIFNDNTCKTQKTNVNNKTLKASNSADHTSNLESKINTIHTKLRGGGNNINCKIPKRNNRISNITVNINNKTDLPNNTFHKSSKTKQSLSLEHSQSQKKTNSYSKTDNKNNNNDIVLSSNQTIKKCLGNKNTQIKILSNNLFNSKGKKLKNKEIDYNFVSFGNVVRKTFDKEKNNNKHIECNNKRIISGNRRQLSSVSAGNSKGNITNNSNNKTIQNSKRKLSMGKNT